VTAPGPIVGGAGGSGGGLESGPDHDGDTDGLFVKICGITSEADALLAVGMGASAVGFVFAPSPRQMTPTAVADIVKRLPHGIVTVGVFRDEARQRVVDIANQIGLGAVQLHGMEATADTQWVRTRTRWTIKAFPAGHRNIERFGEYGAQTLLIDGASPGSGELFDWRLAEGVVDPTRLIVSGGLRPDNVGAAIEHLHPWGVDVASGVEASSGVKDPGKLREFIGAAHAAARSVAARGGGAVATVYSGNRDTGGSGYGAGADGGGLFDWQDDE
jgi:phosphoribosylanthranilate isomerase